VAFGLHLVLFACIREDRLIEVIEGHVEPVELNASYGSMQERDHCHQMAIPLPLSGSMDLLNPSSVLF
jgi:hypothetical protein